MWRQIDNLTRPQRRQAYEGVCRMPEFGLRFGISERRPNSNAMI